MKKYVNISFIYAILAIASGVFYREFTKFNGFSGRTTLSITHLHFFVLGTMMFLLIALLCAQTNLEEQKSFQIFMKLYNIGLPFMVIMFYIRGITQVLYMSLSTAFHASISGISGIAHIIMTISLVMFFISLKKVNQKI